MPYGDILCASCTPIFALLTKGYHCGGHYQAFYRRYAVSCGARKDGRFASRGLVVKFVSVFLKQELFSDTFVLSAGNF